MSRIIACVDRHNQEAKILSDIYHKQIYRMYINISSCYYTMYQ